MKISVLIIGFFAITVSSLSQEIEPSKIFDIYFHQDFTDDTPGDYIYSEMLNDFPRLRYNDTDPRHFHDDQYYWDDYDQIKIIEENGNKCLRHITASGEYGTGVDHGMQWLMPLETSFYEVYFTFKLRIPENWDHAISGKFLGLAGSPIPSSNYKPEYDDGYSARLSWTSGDWGEDLMMYVYHHDQPGDYGQVFGLGTNGYYGIPDDGEWHIYTIRVVMNTVDSEGGNNDGILEVWIDGEIQLQKTNLRFRNHASIGTDILQITNFYGGTGEDFAPKSDQYCDFDDFFAFTYKPGVDVPHLNVPSPSDRKIYLPYDEFNDALWRKSITANAVSSKTIKLDWNKYFYPVSYTIQRKTESETDFQDIITLDYSTNSYQNTGLLPNTTYSYRIKAENSISDPVTVTTQSPVPVEAPTSLVSLATGKTDAKIGWNDNSINELGFIIERSDITSDNFIRIAAVDPNVTEFTDATLALNTSYFYRVKAYNEDTQTVYSNILSIKTLQLQIPSQPSELIAVSITKDSCLLGWKDNSDNESGFQIYRSLSESSGFEEVHTNGNNQNTYLNGNLNQGTTYFYKVRAYNDDGVSEFTNTLQVTTSDPPESPANLILKNISINSVSFEWTDNSDNEDGFYLERSLSTPDLFISIDTLEANSSEFTDNYLNSNTSYYFRLIAYNGDGLSGYSDTLSVQTPEDTVILAPAGFKTDLVKYDKVTLSWSFDEDDIQGFEIERSTDTSEYILIARTGIVTSFSDTTVEEGVNYIYRIRSFNASHFSFYSFSVSASVPYLILPEPPELLSPVSIESNAIAIKWTDKSTDESGFIVKRALYPKADYKELFTTDSDDTIFIDRTVTPNTTYYYMVNAVNEYGLSKNSNQLRVSSLSLAEAARYKNGLIAYYNFSLNSDTIIHDLSGFGNPLDLYITDTMSVNWTKNSRFEIKSNTLVHSLVPATKVVNACKKTNEITLECWIKPTLTDYNSDATIISLSQDPENLGISLMQSDYSFTENKNYKYLLGLSTKSTETTGRPYLTTDENDIITMHHIAYTRNDLGEEKLYLNGEIVANSLKPLGFDNWKSHFHLYLGNESTMQKPWMGMFYLMAIYDVALTQDQITQNFIAGPTDNISNPDNEFEVRIFPNPSSGRVSFDIKPIEFSDYGEKVILQLTDLNGAVQLQEVIHDSSKHLIKEFDLSYLNKGVYYFRLISTTGSTIQKVILF